MPKEERGSSRSKASTKANVPAVEASGERPQRSTRGKGGARAQLATVADRIRPDLNPGVKRPRTKDISKNVPVNAMAPPAKQRRGEKIADLLPAMNDPPLNLNPPKPSFASSRSGSTFGFRAMVIQDTDHPQDTIMADNVDDANKMDEDAVIANEGQDAWVDGEPEDNIQPTIEDGILDLPIDEQSPDEDDRLALQFLRGSEAVPPHDVDDYGANSGCESEMESKSYDYRPPRRLPKITRHRFISSDDEPDNDSYQVLDLYHRKNRPIKPPPSSSNLRSAPANRSQVPVDHSDAQADHPRGPANRSQVPVDHSDAPAGRPRVLANQSQVPVDHSDAPAGHPRVPASRSQVPVDHYDAPADRPRVQVNQSQVPVDHSDAPAGRSRVPAGHSHVPAGRSRVPASRSQVPVDRYDAPADRPRVPANQSQVLVDHSDAPAGRSRVPDDHSLADHPRVPANHAPVPTHVTAIPADRSRVPADENPIDGSHEHTNQDNSEDEDLGSNNKRKPRAIRNSRSNGEVKPTNLGFYSPPWSDVLVIARDNYRKHIHTMDPFPERNSDKLKETHMILLDTIAEYKETVGAVDNAVYNDNCTGMTLYIFEDGAAYRGRMKGMARNVVNLYYKDELDPAIEHNHNSDQRDNIIADNVKKLIDNSLFLQGPLDTNGRSENFGHAAIADLIKRFYYNGKPDCLSTLFPAAFETCPKACLAMACTCIVNCLHEWKFGYEVMVPFTGEHYESVHMAMTDLMDELEQHVYHGPKFKKLLKTIATDSKKLQSIKRGNPKAHGFKIILD